MDDVVRSSPAGGVARADRVAKTARETDALILVDAADRVVGRLSKSRCHDGKGVLHRAFSLLIFNGAGELLIQQRSAAKRLWPLYWSNSCCSHPRSGEDMETATRRRLKEELGIACPLQFLFKFQYQAQFDAAGSEHELCSVFIGTCSAPLDVDPNEISAWRWVDPYQLESQLTSSSGVKFTPWFTMEWMRIWRDHRDAVLALRA
ncbi:MAG TPA: isopentenyl-diphosphate Delta-isomerase [Steroidobacteraceae bacterium]|nr:isopentenyl-diphosphate Delta-isomerase [Steroidobacteraceae bacterium]